MAVTLEMSSLTPTERFIQTLFLCTVFVYLLMESLYLSIIIRLSFLDQMVSLKDGDYTLTFLYLAPGMLYNVISS